jgi:DNA polymerase-1
LKSTYADAIPKLVNPKTGRVHTSFNQTRVATGRLSSSTPNLQNIPVPGEEGAEIRNAFHADSGHLLVSSDYSQIELRVLAHISGDEALQEAFKKGEDIHTSVASSLFDVPHTGITHEMRRKAKVVNFGIAYGISPHGLSKQLRISHEEAKMLIDSYFARYRGVAKWREENLKNAHAKGYVKTIFGRIRYIPQLKSSDTNERAKGEREAINTPIQGTSADIMKMAMVRVWRRIKNEGLNSKIVLQVHDEIILESPENEVEKVKKILKEEMEGVCEFSVPLSVDVKVGRAWAEV